MTCFALEQGLYIILIFISEIVTELVSLITGNEVG